MKSLICGLAIGIACLAASGAPAAFTLEVEEAFYSAMGGGPSEKNYFLTSNIGAGEDSESMGFLKFDLTDLPAEAVTAAYLSLEKIDKTGLNQPSTDEPMKASVQAVTEDVSKITSGEIGIMDFQADYIGAEIDTVTITDPGFYCWDVTELVNGWIGGAPNYGFVLTGRFDDDFDPWLFPYFAGKPNDSYPDSLGMEPVIGNQCIPEPATMVLLGVGVLAALLRHRRR